MVFILIFTSFVMLGEMINSNPKMQNEIKQSKKYELNTRDRY